MNVSSVVVTALIAPVAVSSASRETLNCGGGKAARDSVPASQGEHDVCGGAKELRHGSRRYQPNCVVGVLLEI